MSANPAGLLPYENESTIKRHFQQALKEATCLRYGSCSKGNLVADGSRAVPAQQPERGSLP